MSDDLIIEIPIAKTRAEELDARSQALMRESAEADAKVDTGDAEEKPDVAGRLKTLEAEIESLRTAALTANAATAKASALAEKESVERVKAEKTAFDLRKTAISTSRLQAKERAEALEGEAARLLESGNYVEAARKNREAAREEARLLEFERLDDSLKAANVQAEAPRTQMDPVDAFVASAGLLPKEEAWVRKNENVLRNPKLNRALGAAATLAEVKGLHRGTEDYFEFIETQLGLRGEAKPAAKSMKGAITPVAAPVSAPVTRAEASTSRKVRLTADQANTAKELGLTEAEFAASVWKMSQPGFDGPQFSR